MLLPLSPSRQTRSLNISKRLGTSSLGFQEGPVCEESGREFACLTADAAVRCLWLRLSAFCPIATAATIIG